MDHFVEIAKSAHARSVPKSTWYPDIVRRAAALDMPGKSIDSKIAHFITKTADGVVLFSAMQKAPGTVDAGAVAALRKNSDDGLVEDGFYGRRGPRPVRTSPQEDQDEDGDGDEGTRASAMDELSDMAETIRGKNPTLSKEQAFARAMATPEGRRAADRERNARLRLAGAPGATSVRR
jgi:hypothetical protein